MKMFCSCCKAHVSNSRPGGQTEPAKSFVWFVGALKAFNKLQAAEFFYLDKLSFLLHNFRWKIHLSFVHIVKVS